jgi:D-lactate dehydrogenase (cytochrome)
VRFASDLKSAGRRSICSIEFFDKDSILFLQEDLSRDMDKYDAAIFYEIDGDSEETLMERLSAGSAVAERYGAFDEDALLASSAGHISLLKTLRHKVPENINRMVEEKRKNCPGITKLGTDMAVPDEMLFETMAMYRSDLEKEKLKAYIFGHIGNCHLHVNIVSDSMDEYERGRSLFMKWAETIILSGGTVSAEHGIGKLKTELLYKMYGEKAIEEMKQLKHIFDKNGLLNIGNLFT